MAIERRPHILKANKTNARPRYTVFLDTETTPVEVDVNTIEHRLRLGVACLYYRGEGKRKDKQTWHTFTRSGDFWDWLDAIKTGKDRICVIAHNMDFDFMVLGGFAPLTSRGWRLLHFINSQAVNIWQFRKDKRSLLFLDNMNYFKMSLRMLGDNIGLPKLDIDFDTCTDKELSIYCRRDVEIMIAAWQKWHKYCIDNDLGVWAPTVTGQAFNAFRHRFMDTPPYIHINKPAIELERKSYHGGRSECFRIGKYTQGPYYMLDVNSMYPYIMLTNRFPSMLRTIVKRGDVHLLQRLSAVSGVIADCEVTTDIPVYPAWYNDRLVFPLGRFEASLTTPEILFALSRGHITGVGAIAVYAMADLFSRYVRFFYSQRIHFRADGNIAYGMIAKLMLNSLYGKFGQKIDVWDVAEEDAPLEDSAWKEWDMESQRMRSFRCIGGTIEEVVGHAEGYNAFPAICAHVTAYARLYLWEIIRAAGKDHCYYCDTDSVIVDAQGYNRMLTYLDPKTLGLCKVEAEADTLNIYNVKQYTFGDKRKCKGVKADAKCIGENTYTQWHQVHIAGALRAGTTDRCTWRKITKHISTEYKKGLVQTDGCIKPFELDEPVLASEYHS